MKQHSILPGIIRPLVAAGLFGFAAMASAQSSGTTTMNVSSTLSASCSVAATALSFGSEVPSPMIADVDTTATITATCSNGRPYTIGMGAGNGVGATEGVRKMTGSGGTIDYAVYSNSGRSTIWGTTAGTLVSVTGNGLAQPLTAYGRMPRQATAGPGTYVDSVTVTINF
jgi:spore coat protein U-like protein